MGSKNYKLCSKWWLTRINIAFGTSVVTLKRLYYMYTDTHETSDQIVYKTYSALECNYTAEALWKKIFGCLWEWKSGGGRRRMCLHVKSVTRTHA